MSFAESSLLLSYLVRAFVPINPFYTNVLVELKEFTNWEVSNLITPFFFHASFLTILVSKPLLRILGMVHTSMFVSVLQLINMVLFTNLPKKNVLFARFIYALSGFVTTLELIFKAYLGESQSTDATADRRQAKMAFQKAIATSLGSMVGQDIVQRTGHYGINIHISIFTQAVSLGMGIYTKLTKASRPGRDIPESALISSLFSMNRVTFAAFCAGAISSSTFLFVKFFSHSIFRDRGSAETVEVVAKSEPTPLKSFLRLLRRILMAPITIISVVSTLIVRLIFPQYWKRGNAQKKYLNGNVDAVLNILCTLAIYLVTECLHDDHKEGLYISCFLFMTLFLMLMAKAKNRIMLSVLYIATSTFARAVGTLTKWVLGKRNASNTLDTSIIISCYMSEYVLHMVINEACKYKKVDSITKAKVYAYIALGVFMMIFSIYFLEWQEVGASMFTSSI